MPATKRAPKYKILSIASARAQRHIHATLQESPCNSSPPLQIPETSSSIANDVEFNLDAENDCADLHLENITDPHTLSSDLEEFSEMDVEDFESILHARTAQVEQTSCALEYNPTLYELITSLKTADEWSKVEKN